jgi:hypothetical protein
MQTIETKRELILRNCDTDFYGDEILDGLPKFNAEYFAGVRDGGYTGIWIRGQLRDLVHFDEAPQWDNKVAARVEALKQIIETGRQAGVGIFLYFNEPRGLDAGDPIYEKYPDLQGPKNPLADHFMAGDFEADFAFCTQSAFTETYLTGGFEKLFRTCPGIAGVLLITTSEILSHCFSNVDERNLLNEDFKYREILCPRCKNSTSIATIIDVVEKIRKGIRAAESNAKIVAWNWSWGMHEEAPQKQIISGLSKDVSIMCDMQRGGSKTVNGIDLVIEEYSFSYLGPSPLFIETAQVAEEFGHELWAKIMVNATHEFLVTPYLPLPFRLAKKMIPVRDLGSRGIMCCWSYGGFPDTYMAQLGSKIFCDESFTVEKIDDEVLAIATRTYGEENADLAFRAWRKFDEAFEFFPFDLFLIYYGPHMHGPGFEWVFTPEEIPMPWYSMNQASRRGTKLSDWCGALSPQQIIDLLTELCDHWKPGVETLAAIFGVSNPFDALPNFDDLLNKPGFEDFNIARTIYLHYQSTIDFVKFRLATLQFFEHPKQQSEAKIIISQLIENEKPRIRAMSQIIAAYPQIPVAEEAQKALYTVDDLDQKLADMEKFSFQDGQSF